MKYNKLLFTIAASILAVTSSNAGITINTAFGQAFTTGGVPVPDGTLWALVADTGNTSLPGGISAGAGSSASLAGVSSTTIDAVFSGASIAKNGTIGGDFIFAIGGFNGFGVQGVLGSTANSVGVDLSASLVSGRIYGFYFFPGVTYVDDATVYSVGNSVGGVTSNIVEAGNGAMVIPNDGFTSAQGAQTNAGGDLGGSIEDSSFTAVAVTVIPEPSAVFLGAIGALGLLRRRRI